MRATVHGNVISNGGEAILSRNFPIKDNKIDGNLIVQGWSGLWIGILRTTVGGNVIFSNNEERDQRARESTRAGDGGPDSSEVMTNVIGGNLICHHNTPARPGEPRRRRPAQHRRRPQDPASARASDRGERGRHE